MYRQTNKQKSLPDYWELHVVVRHGSLQQSPLDNTSYLLMMDRVILEMYFGGKETKTIQALYLHGTLNIHGYQQFNINEYEIRQNHFNVPSLTHLLVKSEV